ncbi:MAG TPA: PqiC family protein [Steroidobacteraceae bacterium]
MKDPFWLVAATCVLVGCAASPPVHFYMLSDSPADTRRSDAGALSVRVQRVTIPPELERMQLVRRLGPTQLKLLENEQWAAPLEDMIRRVLSADLAARLPVDSLQELGAPSVHDRQRALDVDIHEFYGDGNCAVTLRATWMLATPGLPRQAPDSRRTRATEEIRIPGDGCTDPAALPLAMSRALGVLSDHIAARAAAPGDPVSRPAPARSAQPGG